MEYRKPAQARELPGLLSDEAEELRSLCLGLSAWAIPVTPDIAAPTPSTTASVPTRPIIAEDFTQPLPEFRRPPTYDCHPILAAANLQRVRNDSQVRKVGITV